MGVSVAPAWSAGALGRVTSGGGGICGVAGWGGGRVGATISSGLFTTCGEHPTEARQKKISNTIAILMPPAWFDPLSLLYILSPVGGYESAALAKRQYFHSCVKSVQVVISYAGVHNFIISSNY